MPVLGDLNGAKVAVDRAAKLIDDAKPLIDAKMALCDANSDDIIFSQQLKPLRVQIHRLCGQILAGLGDMVACENEFRTASENYSDVPGIWEALARVLDIQGKTEEANQAKAKLAALQQSEC